MTSVGALLQAVFNGAGLLFRRCVAFVVLQAQSLWTVLSVRLGLRQRYLMTRGNRLRLRYMIMPVLFVCAGLSVLLSFSTGPSAMNFASGVQLAAVSPVVAEVGEEPQAIRGRIDERLDGSLYGQLSLASAISRHIPQPVDRVVTIGAGDALGVVMGRSGIGNSEASQAIAAMSEHFNPRHLKAGQDVQMHFIPVSGGGHRFERMRIEVDPLRTVVVHRMDDGFSAEMEEKPVERVQHAGEAKIEVSLYGSAGKAGIPKGIVAEAIRIYSWNVDFQRDIRQGDTLEVLYDSYETPDGYVAKSGDILYAKLTLGGRELPLYRYEMEDGRVDYFQPDGRSIRRTLMKTPIDGARMSSGFGMRKHPILGYNKMHKGVDFAASVGTPIFAAGDGVVERAGRNGSYGKYVRIRHNSSLKTAYAHMSRIEKGVSSGTRVKQGTVIGYVGTTGRSTGPHLHYEVLKNGQQVNPRSVDLPTGETLTGKEKKEFERLIRERDQAYAALVDGVKYARRDRDHTNDKRYN